MIVCNAVPILLAVLNCSHRVHNAVESRNIEPLCLTVTNDHQVATQTSIPVSQAHRTALRLTLRWLNLQREDALILVCTRVIFYDQNNAA